MRNRLKPFHSNNCKWPLLMSMNSSQCSKDVCIARQITFSEKRKRAIKKIIEPRAVWSIQTHLPGLSFYKYSALRSSDGQRNSMCGTHICEDYSELTDLF